MESSVFNPASYLMVPFLVAAHEIHSSTYVVNHVVHHNAPKYHRVDGVLHLQGDTFLFTECFTGKRQGFQVLLTISYIYRTAILYSDRGL